MEQKKTDKKMIVGLIIILAVLVVAGGFFWSRVGLEAQKVKEEEAREEAMAISAIYIEYGDVLKEQVFVDMDTEALFTAEIPEEGIRDEKGQPKAGDKLEHGDTVKVYGNGVMGMSLPGVYAGVTKIQRTGHASDDEIEKYEQVVQEVLKGIE